MHIDLPAEAILTAEKIAQDGEDAQMVILVALEKLASERREVSAVLEGVVAYEEGRHRPLEEFGADLKKKYGIDLPGS